MDHVKPRHVAVAVLTIAFTVTGGPGLAQRDGTAPPAGAQQLNAILDAWVQHSSQIKTLSAKFRRKDKGSAFGAMEFLYEIHWKDSGQAVVDVECVAGKDKADFRRRVVWTGREVWEYRTWKKEIRVHTVDQVRKDEVFQEEVLKQSWGGRLMGNQFDLIFPTLSNPQGVDPLPFLVGMKETVAKKQFRFELLDASDPQRFVIRATPLGPDQKSLFKDILITLDSERCLPIAVAYRRGWRDKDIRQFTLIEANLDRPLADAAFEPRKLEGWEVKYESPSK
jgi:hypothetical protein